MSAHVVRRLLTRLLLFVVLLVILDQALGRIVERLYLHSRPDVLLGTRDHPPVIVIGSSRAHRHYDPAILAAHLGAPAWNFGQDGQFGPAYQRGLMTLILATYTPRLVILDVSAPLFYSGPDDYDRLNVLAPYAVHSADIRSLLRRRSNWEPVKLLSRLYPYNSQLLEVVNQSRSGPRQQARLARGFAPAPGEMTPELLANGEPVLVGTQQAADSSASAVNVVDSMKRADSERLVALLRSHGVTLVAIRSPTLLRSQWAVARNERQARELGAFFATLGVAFIDFSAVDHAVFRDPRLYADWTHLNKVGAERFSALVADSLRVFRH